MLPKKRKPKKSSSRPPENVYKIPHSSDCSSDNNLVVPIPDQPLTKVVLKLESNSAFLEKATQVKTYINCDMRYFNFKYLTDRLGYFDVILIDPPWRIKGGEKNDTPFMFSNSKFSTLFTNS